MMVDRYMKLSHKLNYLYFHITRFIDTQLVSISKNEESIPILRNLFVMKRKDNYYRKLQKKSLQIAIVIVSFTCILIYIVDQHCF